MKLYDTLHLIAGFFIMLTVGLGLWVDPNWYYLTGFIGFMLFQSGITKFCPLAIILSKLGLKP